MTYPHKPGQNGNPLAEKLRREYRGRGESLRGMSATSTEELMQRAQRGRNPRVNVSEQAFAERVQERRNGYTSKQMYTESAQRGKTQPKRQNTDNTHKKTTEKPARNVPDRTEILVKKKRLPVTFLLLLSFVTLMVMMIILSIAQIYKTTDEISGLENQLTKLQSTATELELRIEEKNDIRVIEQIATDRLGMVKEDSVQKKYISLSDGERIDLVTEENDTAAEGGLGSMLSSIWTAFGDFFKGLQ